MDLDAFKSLGLSDGAGLFAVLCPGALPAVVLSVDTVIDRSGIAGASGNDPYPDFLKSLGFACRTCQSAVRYEALRIAVILDVYGVLYRIDFSEFSCKIHLDSFETLGLAGCAGHLACRSIVLPADVLNMHAVFKRSGQTRVIRQVDGYGLYPL